MITRMVTTVRERVHVEIILVGAWVGVRLRVGPLDAACFASEMFLVSMCRSFAANDSQPTKALATH